MEKRGHRVTFAYRKPPLPVTDSIEQRVSQAGVHATDQFHLNHVLKPSHPAAFRENFVDFFRLSRYLRREKFDILNVHQSHDHVLGGMAARWSREPVIVIRTDHKRDFLKPGFGNRLLMSQLTDGIITYSEKGRRQDAGRFDMPPERVCKVSPALDLSRFDPGRDYKDMRAVFGIRADETVIGMVARFQKYRRTDVFLEAVRFISREFPRVRLLLIGRSSQMEESVVQPMRRLGVEPWVTLGGYQTGDYVDTLACMDLFVFLVPGSDGTARALREAMAMGKPVIVADRGMLPELVENGISGSVVKDTPEDLARAALQLLRDPGLRKAMGTAAFEKARKDFRLDRQAEEVETFYQEMISLGKWRRK
jgi:glycosyltransferase involved in cell wall biosynthesis